MNNKSLEAFTLSAKVGTYIQRVELLKFSAEKD